uniref:Protochlorophyllide reductase ChlB subunit n=1 Tax=Goniotrichopsis reniformis TaxID=468933 RepID=UPI001FCDDF2B|nr:Protochlorophyllide reductase ChlB subunit [Goniotrichopsis reniformis]UNJ14754.1 Protochlorophyllide reductase ChlB subunit [Goniotrichopsis reniformis]
MKLAYWMYTGPAHIGTLRIASSFKNVHAIMHAPLGDDYFNVMQSMLEREQNFTPVTASIVDRHVLAQGSKDKVINNITRKDKEENPDLVIVTPTCTSSILQEDLANFVTRASYSSNADVLLADVNHYRVNELQAADRTLEQVIKFYLEKVYTEPNSHIKKTKKPSVNIIGGCTLGFHNQHDLIELKKIFKELNININLIIPEGTSVNELQKLPEAWFNFVPYRETGLRTARYLNNQFNMPYLDITPMGLQQTAQCLRQIQEILKTNQLDIDFEPYIKHQTHSISQAAWFARSVDCQNLIGKKAIVFGDATHAAAFAKILHYEMGIEVAWAGTYCSHDAEWFKKEISHFCKDIVITDDYNLIASLIAQSEPDAIFGTQMERHIGKRLNIPCGVISSPVHIQNFPLSYKPFLGYEGSNQIADLIYNSFTLGMEDHLLEIFGGHDNFPQAEPELLKSSSIIWNKNASEELNKIPRFIRNKIKRKTEEFAKANNFSEITLETMYAAKESNSS